MSGGRILVGKRRPWTGCFYSDERHFLLAPVAFTAFYAEICNYRTLPGTLFAVLQQRERPGPEICSMCLLDQ